MKRKCFHAQCTFGGFLLLASPQMCDPSFRRTAVLLKEHQRDGGACGFILDRPLNKQLWELLPCVEEGELAGTEVEELPVHVGGPCAERRLILVSIEWQMDGRAKVQCLESLAEARAAMAEGLLVRAFVGYSAWGEGQLESELNADSWMITPPKPSLFAQSFQVAAAWSGHLRSMGAEMELLSHTPQNPLAN